MSWKLGYLSAAIYTWANIKEAPLKVGFFDLIYTKLSGDDI